MSDAWTDQKFFRIDFQRFLFSLGMILVAGNWKCMNAPWNIGGFMSIHGRTRSFGLRVSSVTCVSMQ